MAVRIVSVSDVACATNATAASAVLALQINNGFLLNIKQERKQPIAELNHHLNNIKLNTNSVRLHTALQKLIGKLNSRFSKAKGGGERKKLKMGASHMTLQKYDIVNVSEMQHKLNETEVALKDVKEKSILEEEAMKFLIDEGEREKEELREALHVKENRGKQFHEVGERQKRRKLSQITTYVSATLEPCLQSHGLTPASLQATTADGKPLAIPIGSEGTLCTSSPPAEHLTASTLYLLDRFAVSDQFYHELAQLFPDLPRVHHVKGLRQSLNSDIEVCNLPIPYIGKYMSIKPTITRALKTAEPRTSVTVKLSGDGAVIAAAVFLTFSFPGLAENVLSAAGNHTFASVKGPEVYEFLKAALDPVWEDLGELIADPYVDIDRHQYHLNIVFGSDYKFLAIMTGLNKANATYACMWCTVHKDDRWDMTVPETTYTSPPPIGKARTLESLQTNCRHSRPALHLGSKYSPLLPLEPSQYVLDELHLLLRVADVLVRNIINLADHMDQTQSLRQGRAGTHIPQLEEMVKSCGVPFKISRVQNENGRPVTGMFEWTSLTRKQNLRILQQLPHRFGELFPDSHASKLSSLWKMN